jgi:hypothetical protein
MARADLAIKLDTADDLDRLRRAVEQMTAVGGDCAWLGSLLAERLRGLPDARLARRDEALAALAQTYVGRLSTVSGNVSTELQRYAASAWKRRDHSLPSAPSEYLTQPRRLAAFEAMRVDAKAAALGQKQISRILTFGHRAAVPTSIAGPQNANRTNKRSPAVNALSPISDREFVAAMRRAPSGQAVIQAATARTAAERQKLIDELAAMDSDATKTFPKLQKAVEAEIANVRAAELALRAANERLRLAGLAKSGASVDYDYARQRIEAALRNNSYSTMFDDFARKMLDELHVTRKKYEGGYVQVRDRFPKQGPGYFIPPHNLVGYNNAELVNARRTAIEAALAEAEGLRLAADQADVPARLAALHAGLPEVAPAVVPKLPAAREVR